MAKKTIVAFGLAHIREEGACTSYDGGEPCGYKEPVPGTETRWIELCYDPEDRVDKELLMTICQLIDSRLIGGSLDVDRAKNVITAVAAQYFRDEDNT